MTFDYSILIYTLIIIMISISIYFYIDYKKSKKDKIYIPSKLKIAKNISLFSIFLLLIFISFDLLVSKKINATKLLDKSAERMTIKNNYINKYFFEAEKILYSIKESKYFDDYLKDPINEQKNIEDIFLSFAKFDKNILQLRYLSKEGFEKIRIEKSENDYKIIQNQNFQDKSHRYYYKETINKKSIWYSQLDLNQEFGKLETPHQPTFRAILPILDKDEQFNGELILNFNLNEIFDFILKDLLFDITIFDEDGYILKCSKDLNKDWERFTNNSGTYKEIMKNLNNIDDAKIYKLNIPTPKAIYMEYRLKKENLEKEFNQKIYEYFLILLLIIPFIILFIFGMSSYFDNIISKLLESTKSLEIEKENSQNYLLKVEEEKEKANVAYKEAKSSEEEALLAQEDMHNMYAQLVNANQAKTEFLANMSHEMRTPLAGIIGITNILLNNNSNEQERIKYLEIIKNSSQNLKNIINDILDFTKIQSGKFQIYPREFKLRTLIHNVESLFLTQIINKDINFKIDIKNNVYNNFIGDELRITQILNNLIGNAIKFTDKGMVLVKIEQISKIENIIKLKFEVHDTGIGISQNVKENLFNSFTQGEFSDTKKYQGTGLGLAITKSLVEMMDGQIWFESYEGIGTKFFFTIKLLHGEIESENEIELENEIKLDIPRLERVLIVEDSDVNQLVLKNIISEYANHIDIVDDGFKAVEKVLENSYDLILMDIQMPVMDGYEATKRIRQKDKNTPIIAISASSKKEDKKQSINVGMNAHLLKPVDRDELFKIINIVFDSKDIFIQKINENKHLSDLEALDEYFDEKDKLMLLKVFYNAYNIHNKLNSKNEQISDYIHRLKGASGNLRINRIYNLCLEIEDSNDYSEKNINTLKEILEKVLEEIKDKIAL